MIRRCYGCGMTPFLVPVGFTGFGLFDRRRRTAGSCPDALCCRLSESLSEAW